MPNVAPEVLVWARETAGLTTDEAVKKLAITSTRKSTAQARLQAIEAGEVEPTRRLLLQMSLVYRRSLLTFYMSEPPRRGNHGHDFRTAQPGHAGADALVDALLRDVGSRQSMVKSILADDEEAAPLSFIGSMTMDDGAPAVLASIRQALGIDLPTFRAQGSSENAFGFLRGRAERVGIFVLLMGNLGNYHSAIGTDAFRGFALADPIAPFVVINDQDAKSAWSFTLLHELAHLWIGASGISGAFADSQTERFCNDVASQFLLTAAELAGIRVDPADGDDATATAISQFAEARLIGRSLVTYRLYLAGRLSVERWRSLSNRFTREWREGRDAQRARNRNQESGPSFYVVRRHRLGAAMLQFVSRNMKEGLLTPTKAGKILGVKARNVRPLLSGAAL